MLYILLIHINAQGGHVSFYYHAWVNLALDSIDQLVAEWGELYIGSFYLLTDGVLKIREGGDMLREIEQGLNLGNLGIELVECRIKLG